MRTWLIVLACLYTAVTAAAPAWTWVDEAGRRHYSDRPVPGAEQIELAGAQGFAALAPPARRPSDAAPASAQPYRQFDITSPTHEQTLWNIGGVLPVTLAIQPALLPEHRIDVYLDGQLVDLGTHSAQFTLSDVYRGLHTLQAVIRDASGGEVLRSLQISVMVQQTSILN